MFKKFKKQNPNKSRAVSIEEYQYLKLKTDFYERSNRILNAYLGDRTSIMKMYAELLSRILNYPVSIILFRGDNKLLFGAPFPYIEEYCENLAIAKPFILVTSQNYPVMTFPDGMLVWHNPNYILSLDEDLLYTAVCQISLAEKNLQFIELTTDIDPLTGLYDRKCLTDHLNIEISRSKHHKLCFSLVIFQIDDLKSYSNAYGHQEKDKILITVSEILNNIFKKEDIKIRYSEDKFCILVPHHKELPEKTKSLIEKQLKPPITKRPVTVTVGISIYPDSVDSDLVNIEDLIRIADDRITQLKITQAAGV